jgi:hypothetical protein
LSHGLVRRSTGSAGNGRVSSSTGYTRSGGRARSGRLPGRSVVRTGSGGSDGRTRRRWGWGSSGTFAQGINRSIGMRDGDTLGQDDEGEESGKGRTEMHLPNDKREKECV